MSQQQRPWVPDHEIDTATACRLLETSFPELRPVRLEPFGSGWDNSAFLVNERWIFRFPRRAIAAPLMRTETQLLPMLAGRLPLAVPRPVFVGAPSSEFPWHYSGYARLAGKTACRARLDQAGRQALAAPLAEFLAALHGWDAQQARALGAGHDPMRRWDLPLRLRQIEDRLARLAELGLVPDARPWQGILEALPSHYEATSTHLVHGDLYARHLLVDAQGQAVGVIDWGDIHLGDPVTDLAMVWGFLPRSAQPAFFEVYGEVDSLRCKLARFRAYYYAVILLLYGHDVADAALVDEGRASLELLRV